jgi:hypothetical protein
VGAEVVRGEGKTVEQGDVVNEYTLPHKRWPSIRIVEGATWAGQTDPEWRIRPMMFEALNEAGGLNWIRAMINATANYDMSRNEVIALALSAPEALAQTGLKIKEAYETNTADDSAELVPGRPERFPEHLTAELLELEEKFSQRFEAALLPSVLFGKSPDLARQSPGTSYALLMRQAHIPLDRPGAHMDQATMDIYEDIQHDILFWDYESSLAEEQKYFTLLMGEEGAGEAGERLYISASRLSTHPTLYVATNPEQLAEQQAREEGAWMSYQRGLITFDQLLEEYGYKDAEAQRALLDQDDQAVELRQMYTNARANYALQISSDIMETDPAFLITNPMGIGLGMEQAGGGEGDRMASPTIRPPALASPSNGPSPTGGA